MITSTPFAQFLNQEVTLFVLENDFLKVEILNYGCILKSIVYKPLQRETICGMSTLKAYQGQNFYLGALVGRVGNRINKGQFVLNGNSYQLPLNGTHHLHGGPDGYDKRLFKAVIEKEVLSLSLLSNDGDQGYPGTLQLEQRYFLKENELHIETFSMCDQDTLCDPTQHSYFNLNPDQNHSILNHHLKLNSKLLYEIESDGCTVPQQLNLKDSCFDFSKGQRIEKAMDFSHPQIQRAKGIDHYFLKEDQNDPCFCELSVDDLCLGINTTLPGAHVYSGNYLAPLKAYSLPFMKENGGICFETQHVPNAINFDEKLAPVLKANSPYHCLTIYNYESRGTYGNKKL